MGLFLLSMAVVFWFLYDMSVSGEDKMITRELWEEFKKWLSKKLIVDKKTRKS